MEEKFTNLYDVLGLLSQKASPEDIKKAYRTYAKEFHPDKNPGKEKWADEKMRQLNEAYEILSNYEKRKEFDLRLKAHENYIRMQKQIKEEEERRLRRKKGNQTLAGVTLGLLAFGLLISVLSDKK